MQLNTKEIPQMKISRLFPVLFLAVSVTSLGGCASAPAKLTGNEPLTVKDFIEADGKSKLAGVKRVAIPNFFVQFVRDQTIEVRARLGMESYTTQTRGADPATLQKIADGFYDDFVAELKSTGIEVTPLENLETNADFQEIRTSAQKSPFIEESNRSSKNDEILKGVSVLVSAKNLPINIMTVSDKRWLTPGVSYAFKGTTLIAGRVKMAKALEVPLLDVRLTVSMVTQQGTSQDHSGVSQSTSSFKFKTDIYPRFVEQGTRVSILAGGDANTYSLTKPVVIKDLAYTGESSGNTSARGSGLLGMLGRVVGGSEAMAADAYIDVQPDDFTARVSGRGKEVVRLFVEAMTK